MDGPALEGHPEGTLYKVQALCSTVVKYKSVCSNVLCEILYVRALESLATMLGTMAVDRLACSVLLCCAVHQDSEVGFRKGASRTSEESARIHMRGVSSGNRILKSQYVILDVVILNGTSLITGWRPKVNHLMLWPFDECQVPSHVRQFGSWQQTTHRDGQMHLPGKTKSGICTGDARGRRPSTPASLRSLPRPRFHLVIVKFHRFNPPRVTFPAG